MGKLYKLLSGKHHRMVRGVRQTILAGETFEPTDAEYHANQDRLELVDIRPEDSPDQKPTSAQKLSVRAMLDLVEAAESVAELNRLTTLETAHKPRSRVRVLKAIEERLLDLEPAEETVEDD